MNEIRDVCEAAARLGAEVLERWAGKFSIREKGPADLVTEADLEAQEAIRRYIGEHFPQHGFVGEEAMDDGAAPAALDSENVIWIVDPLDGTANYAHGMPHYAVSIAAVRQGVVLAGTVFNPATNQFFTAARGEGAWCNGKRLQVSRVDRLEKALVAASFPPQVIANSAVVTQLLDIVETAQSFRRTGSAALNLSYVAAGWFDAYWATETKAWDVAAGWLLVEEAGGVLTGLRGEPFDLAHAAPAAAGTSTLHQELIDLLRV